MPPDSRAELLSLLSSLCDGQITQEEHARLESLLNSTAECRRVYLEYMQIHATLLIDPQILTKAPIRKPDTAEVATPAPRANWLHWGRRNLGQAWLVLATLAASLLVQFFWFPPTSPLPEQEPALREVVSAPKKTYVATLIRSVNCVWEAPREPVGNGARLAPGYLRLPKGIASIRFDSGAELIVEGPAEIMLDSSTAVTVKSGKAVLHATDSGVPFDLRTPGSTLVDIATDFGVSVTPDAEEVHVFEGELQRVSNTAARLGAEPECLKAGESRRYEVGSDRAEKPAIDAKEFVRYVVDNSRPALDPNAGLLAYEGFAYDRAMALQNGKATGGIGWSGPWRASTVRPGPKTEFGRFSLNIKETLSRPDAVNPGIGGSFDYAGFARTFRKLAQPVRLDRDGAYYLSFLFRRHRSSSSSPDSLGILLWSDDDYQQQNFLDFRKRLYIGIKGSNQLSTHLQRMTTTGSIPLAKGTTYLLVAKIAAGSAKPEQVFVRVYGPDESVEPEETGTWSLQSSPFRSDLTFEWIELNINGKSRQIIDEIRVGATWESVTAPWLAATKVP
ncbi:MAG TPA: hypothetical protein VFE62_02820 [Gemmataceae bacterium]|nr:hypothetical protein [Gemmataceae bacterium]